MLIDLQGANFSLLSTIDTSSLINYVTKQCNTFFPDSYEIRPKYLKDAVFMAVDRLYTCFSKIRAPYFSKDGSPFFNYLHGDHYSMFLYLLSNTVYKHAENEFLASKLFLLNKALFGIDAFYAVELPVVFLFVHPIGTVLGKANYDEFLVVYQGVTVGATTDLIYPSFSPSTILYSNSSIIGNCNVGSNFILGAKASILNTNIDNNRMVVGNFPSHRILENKSNLIHKYFKL